MIRIKGCIRYVMYRLLAIIICLTLILFNFSNNAYAETSYVYFNGKHHLAGGVGRYGKDTKYFWISDKLSGFLYNCAKDAMLDWSNCIWCKEKYNYSTNYRFK